MSQELEAFWLSIDWRWLFRWLLLWKAIMEIQTGAMTWFHLVWISECLFENHNFHFMWCWTNYFDQCLGSFALSWVCCCGISVTKKTVQVNFDRYIVIYFYYFIIFENIRFFDVRISCVWIFNYVLNKIE